MSFTSQTSTPPNQTFGKDASFKLPQLIGAMSISPSGRDVVLGSKEGLHIIDLDSPYSPPRFLPHRSPWEVADVQWSPFAERDYWVVSTSNQKVLLWNLNAYGWRNSIERVLHAHTRAITDINFSAHHPDRLATCAVDSFVHCWDMRAPTRPANSFSDWFAGATQVKWSRQDENVLASSHDRFLHLWDIRMGAYPARTIEAHGTKIYGIDWNRFEPSKIVTCSLDRTIKFWDTSNTDDVPDRVIETSFPVWRARHTPFGWGLMVMPQRGSGDLHLYDRRSHHGMPESGRVKPVHRFPGHTGQVKEFLWRAFGTVKDGIDHRDFQLVTWGTDRELKLHAVSENVFEDIGYEKGVSRPQRLRFTRRGARYRTFRDEPIEQEGFGILPNADSFPASSQLLRVRGRPSTNMGMSRIPLTRFRGLAHAGKPSRRTDMHGKGTGRPDTDPIAWMKNVKIASWDTNALADEITMIGEKFKRVEFESIDLTHRRATMCLQSPWTDPENDQVYTRLELKFPKGYPTDAQVVVSVQKTNSIPPDTQKRLASDIAMLAEAYRAQGRGCLESIVRYLLREQSLEQILDLLSQDSLTASKVLESANALQEGSDESDDDQLDTVPVAVQSNANINIPLAKGCAASWSESGMLVCFFQHKNKQSGSFPGILGPGQLDHSDSNKLFGGFGQFQVDSPARSHKPATEMLTEDTASETSDQSSLMSSSTSSSETPLEFEEKKSLMPWQSTTMGSLQRNKSDDGSQKSTVMDSTQTDGSIRKAYIAIHDLSHLCPNDKGAAARYTILGDMADACKHNSLIAQMCSKSEASTIWRLAHASFKASNSHEMETLLHSDSSVSLLAAKIKKDFHNDSFSEIAPDATSSIVKQVWSTWPGNSLGREYILPALMQFCDRIADGQTLAFLAAIYLQSQVESLERLCKLPIEDRQAALGPYSLTATNGQGPYESQRWYLTGKPLGEHHGEAMHHSGFGLSAAQLQHRAKTSFSKPPLAVEVSNTSQLSSGAPSVIARDPTGVISALHSTSVSVAGSPESHRMSQKAEAIAAYPTATASLQALTKSRPPSPPGNLRRQSSAQGKASKSSRPSPNESLLSESRSRLTSSFSMVNTSPQGENSSDDRGEQNGSHPNLGERHIAERSTKKNVKRKLRTKFCSAPHTSAEERMTPLARHLQLYRVCLNYMEQYVPQLEVWQLWTQKADAIKLQARISALLETLTLGCANVKVQPESSSVVQFRQCCPECSRLLEAVEKTGDANSWHCTSENCKTLRTRPSRNQHCSICETLVAGLSIPCLSCGHLSCYSCAREWFAEETSPLLQRDSTVSQQRLQSGTRNVQNVSCPTGCGCECLTLKDAFLFEPSSNNNKLEYRWANNPKGPRSDLHENDTSPLTISGKRLRRGQSVGNGTAAADSALNALLALNAPSRHRSSLSSAKEPGATQAAPTVPTVSAASTRTRDNSISVVDELLPWANDKNATLGRGIGGGLSRGLSSKGSNSTIRKVSKTEEG